MADGARHCVGVLVVLMGLIKGSHFGAAPWDSYRDGLSTRQFSKYTILDFGSITMAKPFPRGQAPPWRLVGQGSLGTGCWALELMGLSSASRRTLRGLANDLLWLWRLLDRGLLQLMLRPVSSDLLVGARW